ncbi:MAG: hypothetical protein IJR71_09585 [Prevotella sp.]|nr:hypothetical protein [Prevotella sp.]
MMKKLLLLFMLASTMQANAQWKHRGIYNELIGEGTPAEVTVQKVMTFFDDYIIESTVKAPVTNKVLSFKFILSIICEIR